jgi:hypothetical protein
VVILLHSKKKKLDEEKSKRASLAQENPFGSRINSYSLRWLVKGAAAAAASIGVHMHKGM